MILRIIIFLVLNFGALAIGGLFTGDGVSSEWYQILNKAPWTPPGWVFGAAWTTIMVCFSFYMASAWIALSNYKSLTALYTLQLALNMSWNPVFFEFHAVLLGLCLISALTLLIGYFFFSNYARLKIKSFLVLPYFLWLLIATSLNAYIYWMN